MPATITDAELEALRMISEATAKAEALLREMVKGPNILSDPANDLKAVLKNLIGRRNGETPLLYFGQYVRVVANEANGRLTDVLGLVIGYDTRFSDARDDVNAMYKLSARFVVANEQICVLAHISDIRVEGYVPGDRKPMEAKAEDFYVRYTPGWPHMIKMPSYDETAAPPIRKTTYTPEQQAHADQNGGDPGPEEFDMGVEGRRQDWIRAEQEGRSRISNPSVNRPSKRYEASVKHLMGGRHGPGITVEKQSNGMLAVMEGGGARATGFVTEELAVAWWSHSVLCDGMVFGQGVTSRSLNQHKALIIGLEVESGPAGELLVLVWRDGIGYSSVEIGLLHKMTNTIAGHERDLFLAETLRRDAITKYSYDLYKDALAPEVKA